jgi:CheY-like chemotaxis protein
MSNMKPILYLEDDENDVFLMERAISKVQIPNPLRVVEDGKLALAYLAGNPPYEVRMDNPLPCVLIMDLSVPGKHGLEVLKWLRNQPTLAELPVVVMTSSNQECDIERAYELGANGYFVKPGDPGEMQERMKSIRDYWLTDTRPTVAFQDFAPGIIRRPPQALRA